MQKKKHDLSHGYLFKQFLSFVSQDTKMAAALVLQWSPSELCMNVQRTEVRLCWCRLYKKLYKSNGDTDPQNS